MSKIIYTYTDEAPMLATYALLPIIQRFAKPLDIQIERRDISVAGRILAIFPDFLSEEQRQSDDLTWLGDLAKTPEGNIIKLPNISASVPQLLEAIAELQAKGYKVPDYKQSPTTQEETDIKKRYGGVLGSAVNPVLREGNSDRRCAPPVKAQAMKQTKRSPGMKPWKKDNRSCVAHMTEGDFFGSEQSHIMQNAGSVQIVLKTVDGNSKVLKESVKLEAGEVIDATCMSKAKLCQFFEKEIQDCKDKNLMMSLHLKATMMKISDPIIFGHCVKVYFKDVFAKHGALFQELGVNVNNGLGDVYDKLKGDTKDAVLADLQGTYESRPGLAMVDSSKGITNLHVPSDVIIDASMPCVVRDGGAMWNKDDKLEDVKCIIPDRSYSTMYQAVLDDCKANGQFDWTTMGHTSNIGLMAKKAEEYGSHDKTFEIPAAGTVQVVDSASGKVIFSHDVEVGDIWRMCQTKDAPIRDWVKLAVSRARASNTPALFWLDPARAHDRNIVDLASRYLLEHDTTGLDIRFATPVEAMKETCQRARAGKDTISVTGNVLRDYLTDLFPIIELGTSAKMLSIVPLLAGGRLLETGAGGSAPKHVEQFLQENHLRWDSLGEYLATAIGFQELGTRTGNQKATILGDALMEAVGVWLENNKSPGRKVKELDNRGSSFYLCLYWAQALAAKDPGTWSKFAVDLAGAEEAVVKDLLECQGVPVDIGGYYKPVDALAEAAMRPSPTFNKLIDSM